MNTLRVRLTFGVLGVMLFSLFALFLFYQYLSAHTLENELEKRLAQDGALLTYVLNEHPPETFYALEHRLKEMAQLNAVRLWLYTANGTLLLDSAESFQQAVTSQEMEGSPSIEAYVISKQPWTWKGGRYELV
ncbi:MAG: hypothetical protein RBR24_02230, partial [Candidatus Carbobacillus sp.]|nr:hypothetical protein [Candidatus Carbobacillus sp.]